MTMIFSFVYIHDFVILLGQNMNHGHVIIRVPEFIFQPKKKVLQVRILDFYHKLFPWTSMIPLSLTAVAYMSVTTFICDDYTTCLKIIKLINCITQVTMILRPCRNNAVFFWVTNFRQEWPSLLFFLCVHMLCMLCFTHTLHTVGKCKLTQFPQKWNNKSDQCWQIWLCDWVTQLVKF